MEIYPIHVTVRDLVEGYKDRGDDGVVGYRGRLNIRPPYQRDFVYDGKNRDKRDKVIETLINGHPLSVMYWVEIGEDKYEVLDGQQRIISICQYVEEKRFAFEGREFHALADDEKEKILNYDKMTVYICKGTDSEKIKWFKTINIAGLTLTDQEMNNAVYHGKWVADAKRYFSKKSCQAKNIGEKYITGVDHRRQELLELAIEWVVLGKKNKDGDPMNLQEYMSANIDNNADELWKHYNNVISWVKEIFEYRSVMKGIDWGTLYHHHKDDKLDPKKLEEEIAKLMADYEVTNKKGIYKYVLSKDDDRVKYLNIRTFSQRDKRTAYEEAGGLCANRKSPKCKTKGKKIPFEEAHADHKKPWSKGGSTDLKNCRILCKSCNLMFGNKNG